MAKEKELFWCSFTLYAWKI